MPLRAANGATPDWNSLLEHAQSQAGYFTTQEAASHHIGTALLTHHVKTGKFQQAGRGVFRVALFPSSPREELVPLWLWSKRMGVFSHETALSLHGLSDLAPTHADMTLPSGWSKRRLKIPTGLVLHFQTLPSTDRTFWGPLPCTSVLRTLNDCVAIGVEEQFLSQSVREAFSRGQIIRSDQGQLAAPLRKWLPRSKAVRR